MRLLLDSVIIIDHFNGISKATAYLAAVRTEAAVSVITRAEVLAGLDDLAVVKAQRLLDCFPALPIDRDAADLAARLRRSHAWRLPDAFQAALALKHGLRLVTRNTKDFPPSKHSFVLVPYRL